MLKIRPRKTRIIAALLLSGTLLVACSPSDQGSSATDKAADRANVDAMTREHANDTTAASMAAETAPAKDVISEIMPYAELGNQLVYGYFVVPSDMFEPLPAVIMIHEWWGLNDNIRAMADRLAAEGYIVLAVDLYGGKVAENIGQAREYMLSVVEDPEAANANLRSAYEFVTATADAPRVGTLGWCFGGGWSLNMAQLFPDDLDATVIYYGQVTDDEEKLSPIKSPILGIFAEKDSGIKVSSVNAFGEALTTLEKNHEIHVYPGVGHAFANPTGRNYNEAAATDAWQRTLEFLDLHLSLDAS